MVRAAVALLLALPALAGAAPDPLAGRTVVAGPEAHVLLAPEVACGPGVLQAKWSTDGQYVLSLCRSERLEPAFVRAQALRREPAEPPGDVALVLWSRDTHRSREVWRSPIGRAEVEQFSWVPGSGHAVAVVLERTPRAGADAGRAVLWLSAAAGTCRTVTRLPVPTPSATSGADLEVSPTGPVALVSRWVITTRTTQRADGTPREVPTVEETLAPIRNDGTLGPPLPVAGAILTRWSADGRLCYLMRTERPSEPGARPKRTVLEADPRTGQVRAVPSEPPDALHSRVSYAPGQGPPDPEEAPLAPHGGGPLRLALPAGEARLGDTTAAVRPLWLEAAAGEPSRALVCADARWARLSPSGDAVLYLSQGAAWVRPILRVTAADHAAMQREEARRQTVADAETLSRALHNLVESGERYPTDDEQLRQWLLPYLRGDERLFGRLVYTHGPGRRLPAEEARTTVLGHVLGPGGRAVIYADGRAVWHDE